MIQQEGVVTRVNIHEDIRQSPTHFNNLLTNAFFYNKTIQVMFTGSTV